MHDRDAFIPLLPEYGPYMSIYALPKDCYFQKHNETGEICGKENPFLKRQILDSSKLKEFADNNFEFDENDRKLSKRVETLCQKEKFLFMSNSSFFHSVSKGI